MGEKLICLNSLNIKKENLEMSLNSSVAVDESHRETSLQKRTNL